MQPFPPVSPERPVLQPDDGRLARGRRSRARIRDAARQLFRERGFDGTTLRAIADRAGMGASSIYRHFRSKEELLVDELSRLRTSRASSWTWGTRSRTRSCSTRKLMVMGWMRAPEPLAAAAE